MKRTMLVLLIAGVALVAGSRVQAHHSFAATYFEDQTVSIEGNLVQFLFRNPHSFVHVEAPDKDGQTAALGRRMGRGRSAQPSGCLARNPSHRRSRDRHRQPRPQPGRPPTADEDDHAVRPTAGSGAARSTKRLVFGC